MLFSEDLLLYKIISRRPDVFYLELYLIVLENIVFNGIGNIETPFALDVSCGCTLSESDAIKDIARLGVN